MATALAKVAVRALRVDCDEATMSTWQLHGECLLARVHREPVEWNVLAGDDSNKKLLKKGIKQEALGGGAEGGGGTLQSSGEQQTEERGLKAQQAVWPSF